MRNGGLGAQAVSCDCRKGVADAEVVNKEVKVLDPMNDECR